jgi:hypothetical protein
VLVEGGRRQKAFEQQYSKEKDHFPFTGQIDKVTINLIGEDADKAKELINPGVD